MLGASLEGVSFDLVHPDTLQVVPSKDVNGRELSGQWVNLQISAHSDSPPFAITIRLKRSLVESMVTFEGEKSLAYEQALHRRQRIQGQTFRQKEQSGNTIYARRGKTMSQTATLVGEFGWLE